LEPRWQPAGLNGLKRHPVDSWSAVILLSQPIGFTQRLQHADMHVQSPKPPGWFSLRLAVYPPPQVLGVIAFLYNVIQSLVAGKRAGNDPWDAWTLEWSTTSPPPEYNFAELPTVHSRRPLWDLKHPGDPDWKYE
jgi:heme/copper-type cytochrome/quinol oxidase subunit 1